MGSTPPPPPPPPYHIGLSTSERLNIVQRIFKVNASDLNSDSPITAEYIPNDYFDCIGDVGTSPSTYHTELKENAQPVVVPPRKLPFAVKERVKKELDRMEKLGVIEKSISLLTGLMQWLLLRKQMISSEYLDPGPFTSSNQETTL